MKRTVLFFAAAIGASTLVCQAQGENVKANSTVLNSNAERILQLLEESDPAVALSAEEESAHVERVRRLYELEKEKPVMEEPSGAEADAASPETSGEDLTLERLIESIEQLQMEIQELRTALRKNTAEATGEPLHRENFKPEPAGGQGLKGFVR